MGKTSGLMGNFYHSEIDDRQALSDTMTRTDITGEDLGYGTPAFRLPDLLHKWGDLSRSRFYSHKTVVKSVSKQSLSVAICVPFFARNVMIYVYFVSHQGGSWSEKMEKRSVRDPVSYGIWTYDPIYHYLGSWGVGNPRPKTGDRVYVNYNPKENNHHDKYSWFADSGNWYDVPEGGYKDVSHLAVYTDRNSMHKIFSAVIGGQSPHVETYSKRGYVSAEVTYRTQLSDGDKVKLVHEKKHDGWYFLYSPQMIGGSPSFFYRDVCKNLMGDTQYSNVSEKVEGKRKYWGNSQLMNSVGHDTAHHFIGVISE